MLTNMYNAYMDTGLLNNLADSMIEYILRELANFSELDTDTIRRIKSAKIYLDHKDNKNYELRIGMGISEASFLFSGKKVSGSIGGNIERLVSYWLTRPLNQAVLAAILKS